MGGLIVCRGRIFLQLAFILSFVLFSSYGSAQSSAAPENKLVDCIYSSRLPMKAIIESNNHFKEAIGSSEMTQEQKEMVEEIFEMFDIEFTVIFKSISKLKVQTKGIFKEEKAKEMGLGGTKIAFIRSAIKTMLSHSETERYTLQGHKVIVDNEEFAQISSDFAQLTLPAEDFGNIKIVLNKAK